jgi:MoxR-like ATPase
MNTITIDDVPLHLSHPVIFTPEWIGQAEALRQLLACWIRVDKQDLPLSPRIIGHPGLGKTTLAVAAGRKRGQDVYIMQCTADTRPEDLLVTPVLSGQGSIDYHASPLMSALITGGIAILDEGNRMSEKSWASLAGLLDTRRTVESVVAGITVTAHPEFRVVVTMNDDSSTFEIPDYIMSRLQPAITLEFPTREDELQILSYNLPFCDAEVLDLCVDYLQKVHGLALPYSIRDGINIARYILKLRNVDPAADTKELFNKAVSQILGIDALDTDALARRQTSTGERLPDMTLGDFFFGDDDNLNPDRPSSHP